LNTRSTGACKPLYQRGLNTRSTGACKPLYQPVR
jgi:hypothetical protein